MSTLEGPLAALREEEIRLVTDAAAALSEIGESAAEDRRRLQEMALDLREMFFIVAVIGEFNAGKSSFINALLGDNLLPIGITPTTEFIELVRHNPAASYKPAMREDGIRVWTHPNTGAEGVAIVDTPGTGSVFLKHERVAKDFLHRSDLVVFLISAKRAFAETERLYLELARNYGKKIVIVINQIDLLKAAEQAEVRRFIEKQVKELLEIEPLIFMVSAREALAAGANGQAAAGGVDAVRAYLRSVYSEAPPAKQKLMAQLDTLEQVVRRHHEGTSQRAELVSLDIHKVREVQKELQEQSLGLETQMKSASADIDKILEGVRQRGLHFIDSNLSVKKLMGKPSKEQLQMEFQEVVIGRALRDVSEAAGEYVNAVVDQSRLYWRGVIDRLNQLRDLLEQEPGGLDAAIYAEQRDNLQKAIRIAETELKSYSSGRVVAEMEEAFNTNMSGFRTTALASIGGLITALVAVATQGPLIGVGAAPLAFPAFVVGAAVAALGGIPAWRYFQRLRRDTRQKFNEKIDALLASYHGALDELTLKERNRLTQYGGQVLTPVFSRLEVLTQRYAAQRATLETLKERIKSMRTQVDALA